MILSDMFTPFFGVVEEINNPDFVGMIKVRVVGYHSDNKEKIPTEKLQWFSMVVNNSDATLGKGESPTGYNIGTTVFGYFVDSEKQRGIVVGALSGMTDDVTDINPLCYGEFDEHPMVKQRDESRESEIKTAQQQEPWDELEYKNECEYPYNDVLETKSGHIKEYDNTEGKERIHEYHKIGTYVEVDSEGNRTVKVVGNGYEIVAGDKNVYVKGTVNLTIDGDLNHYVKGNYRVQVDGNKTEVVKGDHSIHVEGSYLALSDGDTGIDASRIDLNSGAASGNSGIPRT